MRNTVNVALGVGLLGVVGFISLAFLYTRRRRQLVGTVKKLVIYPIKSCAGIKIEQGLCTPHGMASTDGLLRDRQFMVIDAAGIGLDMKKQPTLAKVKTRREGTDLILDAPGCETHCIKLERVKVKQELVPCVVLGSTTFGVECDKDTHVWFSAYLKLPVKLLFFNPELCRRQIENLEKGYHNRLERPTDDYSQTMFPNFFPYLAINEQSCEDLNTKLDSSSQISYRNFRPNILITTQQAWVEDGWRLVTVGDQQFFNEKPCARCRLINVNPSTAEVHPKAEPLNTLRKCRMLKDYKMKSPIIGSNMVLEGPPSVIKVGDQVIA